MSASRASPNLISNFPVMFVENISIFHRDRNERKLYSIVMTMERIRYFRDNGVYRREAAEAAIDKLGWLHAGMNPSELHMMTSLGGLGTEGIVPMEWDAWFWRYGVTAEDARIIDEINEQEMNARFVIDLTGTDDENEPFLEEEPEDWDDATITTEEWMTQSTLEVDPDAGSDSEWEDV